MTVTLLNSRELPEIDVYHQVAVAEGTKLVFVAGQVAWETGGDLADQVEQAYVNVAAALAAAGGTFDDVVKLTVYAVDWTPEKMPALLDGIARGSA